MKFTGTIKMISERIEIGKGDKLNEKIIVCVEEVTEKEYPDSLAIDFVGAKMDIVTAGNGYSVGDVVDIYYNTSFKRYDNDTGMVVYNSIRGRKIDVVKRAGPIDPEVRAAEEDLPFK